MGSRTYAIVAGDGPGLVERPGIIPLLTIPEVCEWLGIGETLLRDLRESEELLPVPIACRVLYDPADVMAYIAMRKEAGRREYESKRKAKKQTLNHVMIEGCDASPRQG